MKEGVEQFFLTDSGRHTVSWVDAVAVGQGKELGLDAVDELVKTACRQICPANGALKECIACDDQLVFWKDKRDSSDGMARSWHH